MQLSLIKNSGAGAHADNILVGSFGQVNEHNQFRIDPELKQVAYLFTLFEQPENLRALFRSSGLPSTTLEINPEDVLTIDIPEEAHPFIKGVLINAMCQRWEPLYDRLMANMRSNAATRALLENEKRTTVNNTHILLADKGYRLFEVPVKIQMQSQDAIWQFAQSRIEHTQSIINHLVPDLKTITMDGDAKSVIDHGVQGLGRDPKVIYEEQANRLTENLLASIASRSQAATNEADIDALFEATAVAPATAQQPVQQEPSSPEIPTNLLDALAAAEISPESDHNLLATVSATIMLPARNQEEAVMALNFVRHLAEQHPDQTWIKLLTPQAKNIENIQQGPVRLHYQPQNDDGDDGSERP